jgi:formate-dependent nitrite reductase membrane component NrfD
MSKYLTLSMRDYLHGLMVAAGTSFVMCVLPFLQSGALPTLVQLKAAGVAAAAAAATYLCKNLFQNNAGQIGKEDPKPNEQSVK